MIYKEQRTRLKYYCANSGPSGHSKNGPTVSWMHPHDAKNPDFLCQALHAQNRPRIGFFLDTFLRPRSDSKMNPKPCQESSKIFTKIVPKPMPERFQNPFLSWICVWNPKNIDVSCYNVVKMDSQNLCIFFCFQESSKNSSYYGFWFKISFKSHQQLPKSFPRASQESSQGLQEASKSPLRPPEHLPGLPKSMTII